jgi:superfamily I DNA and RNA helicase
MPKRAIQKSIIPAETIASRIYFVRGQKVMLDRDLAELYGVQTKVLKQAVRRNINRFPFDFMFELNKKEFENLRSQIVTSSWGGLRYMPMVLTELGVAAEQGVVMFTAKEEEVVASCDRLF